MDNENPRTNGNDLPAKSLKGWIVLCLFIGAGIFVCTLTGFISEKGAISSNFLFLAVLVGILVGLLSSLCYSGVIPIRVTLLVFFLSLFLIIAGDKSSRFGYPTWIAGTLLLGTILTIILEKMSPNDSRFKKTITKGGNDNNE